ncbi:hypothetical protein BJ508DRAFT_323740 [Ascobolus immersus RN42]|uniref:NADH dehydrogenase [ubiquinone] 1 alpha subcomplex subunit 1 n=1 Tax=Ascobolus immersus RN42 TaxID=1160509 RepID=A0A3N4IIE3_ASCIM|nr:hypothetical protein BJ508DRAFT_323740 [Ascobolus immersus RN42]
MPVPFEALLPYAIMTVMFGVTGVSLAGIRTFKNDGLRQRHNVDAWDQQSTSTSLMERDRRLTGTLRGQSDAAYAPPGFELSSEWKIEKRYV